jgi:hypothetical protein
VSKDANKLNVVFVNADKNWDGGNTNQTEDFSFTENTCIQIIQSGDAKATYTLVECGNTTDVENVDVDQPQARKILYNGALYLIMPNGDVYDASGRMIRF